MKSVKNALVVGGSSGLGLCIAEHLIPDVERVFVTGRTFPVDPDPRFTGELDPRMNFVPFKVDSLNVSCAAAVNRVMDALPRITHFVYCAGMSEDGFLSDLSDDHIALQLNLNCLAPAIFIRRLLQQKSGHGVPQLEELIIVTSTSEFTPRVREPAYAMGKAGLGMLARSVGAGAPYVINKLIHVAPGGMKTPFWKGPATMPKDALDPIWVADEIQKLRKNSEPRVSVKILRNPARVEEMKW